MKKIIVLGILSLFSLHGLAQTCNSHMVKNAPDSRYINNNDGTITDTKTHLIWMRCSIGQTWGNDDSCSGTIEAMTWEAALQTVAVKNNALYLTQTDWRLPNIKEISSLVEFSCDDPAINETFFPNTASRYYWSSSINTSSNNYAWSVYFHDGNDHYYFRSYNARVRLVRGGQ